MPRFLNTWTGKFEWHPDPSQVTYAILSHVWREPKQGGEQSYDDVRRIQREVEEDRWVPASLDFDSSVCSDTSMAWAPFAFISFEDLESSEPEYGTFFAHPDLSSKIKGFCKVAREAGFRLAWNDACCIDKTSSAELSEAINSMYEWYRLSDMCYVYLADVSDDDVPQESRSEFQTSRWHRRGWTLQELIAPERIVFLTRTWRLLGTKMGLARTLEKITEVDFSILVGRSTLSSVSVARRMSWAAERKTTRVEDRAYSLFGIFGLHMSPIYGEGENAFLRLQEEIIRTIPDQSIFAWGSQDSLRLSDSGGWSVKRYGWLDTDYGCGLLTSSPSSFTYCSDITSIASSFFGQTLGIQESQVPPVHCIFTPEGVSMRLICLPLSAVPDIRKAFQGFAGNTCARCGQLGEAETLAVLQCQARERRATGTTSILGLPLFRSRREGSGSNRCAFSIGGHISDHDHDDSWSSHAVCIEIGVLMTLLEHVRPTVEHVTLLRHYSGHSIPKSLQLRGDPYTAISHLSDHVISDMTHRTVFAICPHSLDALGTVGIVASPLQATRSEQDIILETTLEFRGAGTTYVVALRLSLTGQGLRVKACFSAERVGIIGSGSGQSFIGASASHDAVGNAPRIPGTFLNLENYGYISTLMCLNVMDFGRPTIISTEFTVGSEAIWGGSARLLRIALQHPFASPISEDSGPPHLWLSIDMSEEIPYATQAILDGFSLEQTGTEHETSNKDNNVFPSCGPPPLPVTAYEYAGRDDIDALRLENDALRAQIAGHSSQMQDMDRKMSAVLAQLEALTSSQRFSTDAVR